MNIVEPIKDLKKIKLMKLILRDSPKGQGLRNELLFTFGINTGIRISDLLALPVRIVLNENGKLLKNTDNISIREEKTDKLKIFSLNSSILEVLERYKPFEMDRSAPLFPSYMTKKALTRSQAYRILNHAAKVAGLTKIGTHTLRKTWGYHCYKETGNLALVQKALGHVNSGDTLRYLGIDQEEINNTYNLVNL